VEGARPGSTSTTAGPRWPSGPGWPRWSSWPRVGPARGRGNSGQRCRADADRGLCSPRPRAGVGEWQPGGRTGALRACTGGHLVRGRPPRESAGPWAVCHLVQHGSPGAPRPPGAARFTARGGSPRPVAYPRWSYGGAEGLHRGPTRPGPAGRAARPAPDGPAPDGAGSRDAVECHPGQHRPSCAPPRQRPPRVRPRPVRAAAGGFSLAR